MAALRYSEELVQTHMGGGDATKRPAYAYVARDDIAGTHEVLCKYEYHQSAGAQYCDKCGTDGCEMYVHWSHMTGGQYCVDHCHVLCPACVEVLTLVDTIAYTLAVRRNDEEGDGYWEIVEMESNMPEARDRAKIIAREDGRVRITEVTQQIVDHVEPEYDECEGDEEE